MVERRLFRSLAIVFLTACGVGQQQTWSTAPNESRGGEALKASPDYTDDTARGQTNVLDEESVEALSFHIREGVTYVQREGSIYLIEPSSLSLLAEIKSPDRSMPACIVTHPAGHRFLLVYQSGIVALWESRGKLIAKSSKTIGRTACGPSSLRVSWDSKDEYFLTNFDEDPRLPSTGVWVWRVVGTALEPTLLAPGKQSRADFFENGAGTWIERNDGTFRVATLEGKVLHDLACEQCVLSPDGRQLAVNQFSPRRHTRLVDLTTGFARWESTVVSAHVWSPSMRWLLGTDDRGPVVIDSSDGRTVARWAHPGGKAGIQARWFGELLVDVGGRESRPSFFGEQALNYQVVFWKAGDQRPRVEGGVPHEGLPEITLARGGDRFLSANTIWSVQGKRLARLQALAPSHGAARTWSADDRYLEGASDKGLVVWDALTGQVVSRLEHRPLQQFVRSWSLRGHDLLINEGPTLIRHTPNNGTVRIATQLSDGKLTFDVQEVVSWSSDSAGAEN